MPESQYKHGVLRFLIAVKREICRSATRNNQLSEARFHAATDEGMVTKNPHCLNDVIRSLLCKRDISFEQESNKPFEIRKRSGGVNYLSQDFASGGGAERPRTRFLRYSWTSDAT